MPQEHAELFPLSVLLESPKAFSFICFIHQETFFYVPVIGLNIFHCFS